MKTKKDFLEKFNNFKNYFFPYDNKTKKAYFAYFLAYLILGIFIMVVNIYFIKLVADNGWYNHINSIDMINATLTPIFNIICLISSIVFLFFGPYITHKNVKKSSYCFYTSFWLFAVCLLLNVALIANFYNNNYFGLLNQKNILEIWAKRILLILAIFTLFCLFAIQICFWVMRRKFTFMPSDYEIYQNRVINKKNKKLQKKAAKIALKQNK